MMTGSTILLSGAVILIAALMVFAVSYILLNWIGRYRGENYESVQYGLMIMTYVLVSYFFWHGLHLFRIPVFGSAFVIFYLLLFLMMTYFIYKKYGTPLFKASLYGIGAVITLFLAELLHSYFIGKLLVVLGRVL